MILRRSRRRRRIFACRRARTPRVQAPTACRPTAPKLGVLYLGLYLTALGTGGLKSSVSGHGSNQFDDSHDGERKKMLRFFNWFYFF
jgi:dipeptide/tripeptide permease